MASAASELPPTGGLSRLNEEELRQLLEQLGTPQGFAVSLAWIPDEATSRAIIDALRSRLPQPPRVIDARTWPKGQPFLRWLLKQADGDCADGRVCIVAGLGGVEVTRHPLRHLNTNRNYWMHAAPCHWVLLLPPYAQLRATAQAAGLPRFALGEEMPDVYSIRTGDYVFEAERGLARIPVSHAETDHREPRFTRKEVEQALEFLRQFDPGEGPEAAALYARALVNELEPFIEYWSLAAAPSARELLERARPDELPPALSGRVLALYAALAEQWRDPVGAARWTEEALDRLETALAIDGVSAGTLTDILAGLSALVGIELPGSSQRLGAALALAVEACELTFGSEHPDVASSLENLGTLHSRQRNYAEAEALDRRALAIREQVFGPGHPDVASSLHDLAVDLGDQGRYAEAEPLYRRALAIREQALEPNHPDVASSLHDLAVDLGDQGRYAEAEPLYRRAIAIAEATLGPDHSDTKIYRRNLARLPKRK